MGAVNRLALLAFGHIL